ERAREMAEISRYLLIFPNLVFHDLGNGFRFRQIWPVAPNRMEVIQWELIPRQERKDMRSYRLEAAITFNGPGGFSAPDDVEALESCQKGFAAAGQEWSDLSRGMHREPLAKDELQTRAFWRQWQALMLGQPGAARTADVAPRAGSAAA
ncbi:MAG TPA: SRPBCC family protein, partial [Chloroflexota bacterium]|nr:SRPBCC family protein [Chloroflexota bacterium]